MTATWDTTPLRAVPGPYSDTTARAQAEAPSTGADVLGAYARPRRTYPTGLDGLDDLLGGGIRTRQLVTLCAPTGAGKSSLAGTWALGWARAGIPVVWGLGELEPAEQAARWAAIAARLDMEHSHVTPDAVLRGDVTADAAARMIAGLPLYVIDLDGAADPWDRLAVAAEQITTRHGCPSIIVIDYLQAVCADAIEGESRHPSVSRAAGHARQLARSRDCAVVAVSSVSRAYYGAGAAARKRSADEADDPRQFLAAAKESGDVEYASAVVLYIDCAEEVSQLGERRARIAIAKCRDGRTGYVGVMHHGPSGLWLADGAAAQSMARGAGGDRAQGDDRRVLEYVRSHPGESARAIRAGMQLANERVLATLERLERASRIVEEQVPYMDARDRQRTRTGWVAVVAP